MKALTLTEPWATLVALGHKRVETRSWQTPYRGEIAIHAAKGMPNEAEMQCYEEPFFTVLREHLTPDVLRQPATSWFPRGRVVAVAHLVTIRHTREIAAVRWEKLPPHERAFGDYSPNRYMWLLRDVQPLTEPIPARGALNVWTVPADVEARIRAQLTERITA